MSRALIWNSDAAEADLAALRTFAEEPAHYFRPRHDDLIPGNDPRYVRKVPFTETRSSGAKEDRLRVVYTITEDPHGKLWRHLTVSVEEGEPPLHLVSVLLPHLGFKHDLLRKSEDLLVLRGEGDDEGAYTVAEPL